MLFPALQRPIVRAGRYYVEDYAASGDGSPESPFTGWGGAPWAEAKKYLFAPGHCYGFLTWPVPALDSIILDGEGTAVLKQTGTASHAVEFIQPSSPPNNGLPLTMSGFVIVCNGGSNDYASGPVGLYAEFLTRGLFEEIRVVNAHTAFVFDFHVLMTWRNLSAGLRDELSEYRTRWPVNGFRITGTAAPSSACHLERPIVEKFSGTGIQIANAQAITMLNGSAENSSSHGSGTRLGLHLTSASHHCTIISGDHEFNATNSLDEGSNNEFINVFEYNP